MHRSLPLKQSFHLLARCCGRCLWSKISYGGGRNEQRKIYVFNYCYSTVDTESWAETTHTRAEKGGAERQYLKCTGHDLPARLINTPLRITDVRAQMRVSATPRHRSTSNRGSKNQFAYQPGQLRNKAMGDLAVWYGVLHMHSMNQPALLSSQDLPRVKRSRAPNAVLSPVIHAEASPASTGPSFLFAQWGYGHCFGFRPLVQAWSSEGCRDFNSRTVANNRLSHIQMLDGWHTVPFPSFRPRSCCDTPTKLFYLFFWSLPVALSFSLFPDHTFHHGKTHQVKETYRPRQRLETKPPSWEEEFKDIIHRAWH